MIMTGASISHIPVMLNEVADKLITDKSGFYIDATFGDGGHTRALLENTTRDALILGIDRDSTAIARGRCIFDTEQRLILRHGKFSALAQIAHEFERKVSGILMDLGISSRQLDNPQRGFSFLEDGPLDMRMDAGEGMTVSQWLASASRQEITKVLTEFGEEPDAAKIAEAIIEYRGNNDIHSTSQLTALILRCKPKRTLGGTHPATRVFQSFRIFINQEIQELKQALSGAVDILTSGGRLAVISFHSLEAREVKAIRPRLKMIYKIKPKRQETLINRRSRSAILRVLEKVV